jgi:hypothetical protein
MYDCSFTTVISFLVYKIHSGETGRAACLIGEPASHDSNVPPSLLAALAIGAYPKGLPRGAWSGLFHREASTPIPSFAETQNQREKDHFFDDSCYGSAGVISSLLYMELDQKCPTYILLLRLLTKKGPNGNYHSQAYVQSGDKGFYYIFAVGETTLSALPPPGH